MKLNTQINFWTNSHGDISSVVPPFNQVLSVLTLLEKFEQSSQYTLHKHEKYVSGSLTTLNISKELTMTYNAHTYTCMI